MQSGCVARPYSFGVTGIIERGDAGVGRVVRVLHGLAPVAAWGGNGPIGSLHSRFCTKAGPHLTPDLVRCRRHIPNIHRHVNRVVVPQVAVDDGIEIFWVKVLVSSPEGLIVAV